MDPVRQEAQQCDRDGGTARRPGVLRLVAIMHQLCWHVLCVERQNFDLTSSSGLGRAGTRCSGLLLSCTSDWSASYHECPA